MTMQKLTVRPVNKKTGYLPDDTRGKTVILFRESGKTVESQIFVNHATSGGDVTIHPWTHYVLAPSHLPR